MLNHLAANHEYDRRTDRRTKRQTDRLKPQ